MFFKKFHMSLFKWTNKSWHIDIWTWAACAYKDRSNWYFNSRRWARRHDHVRRWWRTGSSADKFLLQRCTSFCFMAILLFDVQYLQNIISCWNSIIKVNPTVEQHLSHRNLKIKNKISRNILYLYVTFRNDRTSFMDGYRNEFWWSCNLMMCRKTRLLFRFLFSVLKIFS